MNILFDLNSTYIFKKELFYKNLKSNLKGEKILWAEIIDGEKVNIENSLAGRIGEFLIIPSWCEKADQKTL